MKIQKLLSAAKLLAIISFVGGTGIFLLFYFTSDLNVAFLGLYYALFVGCFNIVFLIALLIYGYKYNDNWGKIFRCIGFMCLNIPILLVYCWFATILMNTMRITFINETGSTITNIEVVGCETKHLDKLDSHERKTVWVGITGDCSIEINYLSNGQRKTESVSGYCTNDMGQKITYKIGKGKAIFDNL